MAFLNQFFALMTSKKRKPKKYKYVVSLGGGCDVATNLILVGLREESLFFDWVWNLDCGLLYVSDIIQDKFEKIFNLKNYNHTQHFLFKDKYPINKFYPNLAVIHHDIINKDYETLKKRADRFLKILESKSKVLFVYYRQQNSICNKDTIDGEFSDLLMKEVKLFKGEISKLYPKLKFNMLILFCTDKEKLPYVSLPENSDNVYFDKVPIRIDDDEAYFQYWQSSWKEVLKKYISF